MVLNGEPDQIMAFGGIDGDAMRAELTDVEPEPGQRLALFTRIDPRPRAEQVIEQVIRVLRRTASAMWPLWFTDVNFADLSGHASDREALKSLIRGVVRKTPAISQGWTELAVRLAAAGRPPKVPQTPPEIELAQLCLAINRGGLNIVTQVGSPYVHAAALVHALEWIARTAPAAVIVLLDGVPLNEAPFDRIMYGAQHFAPADPDDPRPEKRLIADQSWLVPIVGRPHPLNASEQRLAKALARDRELAALFSFNQFISSIYGARTKVDLVWETGRIIVEIDGYADHASRRAFGDDRHRDYELTISGYTILRLTTDELAEDLEKSIEKIRDVVNMRRAQSWGR